MFHRTLIIATILLVAAPVKVIATDQYMTPGTISWLSPTAKKQLQERECNVPTTISEHPVNGIVAGQFATSGQTDIAVLCERNNKREIMIIWGGENACPSLLDAYGDSLGVVGESYIVQHYNAYGGNKPPSINHDAINDIILEKASVVRYCHNETWIELTGAD